MPSWSSSPRKRIDARPINSEATQAGVRGAHRDTSGKLIGGYMPQPDGSMKAFGSKDRTAGGSITPRLDAGPQTPRLDARRPGGALGAPATPTKAPGVAPAAPPRSPAPWARKKGGDAYKDALMGGGGSGMASAAPASPKVIEARTMEYRPERDGVNTVQPLAAPRYEDGPVLRPAGPAKRGAKRRNWFDR